MSFYNEIFHFDGETPKRDLNSLEKYESEEKLKASDISLRLQSPRQMSSFARSSLRMIKKSIGPHDAYSRNSILSLETLTEDAFAISSTERLSVILVCKKATIELNSSRLDAFFLSLSC